MAYVCLSVEQCKNWDRTGKNEYLRQCKNLSPTEKDSKDISNCGTSKDLKRVISDLLWHAVRGDLKMEQVSAVMQEIMVFHPDIPSLILDIMVFIDIETQSNLDNVSRDKFHDLLSECVAIMPEKFVKERIDIDPLSDAGIIKNKKTFYTKLIKMKTKLFYKQQKFNLLREESEGYAKLITELSQEFSGTVNSVYLLEVIKALIGCFNLDPNRVLDVILESFECRPLQEAVFIPLIRSYMCNQTTLCEMLTFKFSFYQNIPESTTPESLYTIVALMMQHDLISLSGIYPHLKPCDSELIEENKKELQEARLFARRLNIVATTGDKVQENKTDEAKEENVLFQDNQKVGLCEAMLKIGNWKHAKNIIAHLPDYYSTSHPSIVSALCGLVHITIDILYRKYVSVASITKTKPLTPLNNSFAPKQATNFAELRDAVFPMLSTLGPQLHKDPILMVKLIRLTKAYMLIVTPDSSHAEKESLSTVGLEFDILSILDESLLPSLSLLDSNCCMAEELWCLLKLYPYHHRYRIYGLWKNETYSNHPLVIRTKAEFNKRIKYVMKRLSKENVKPSGRHIGKLSHSNPGFLFEYILSQIQSWDNLIIPVVDSLKYLTNLSYDVLSYCIIEALGNPEKVRTKHDGTSISLWLQSLSSFCGFVYKKYSIELTGLLQFVANQLKAEKSLDLLILKDIVQKMTGIEALEEMTNDQLDAMAGGELLRAEGGYFSQIRNTKKSSQRLKEALLEQDLAVPLCLLMAQQRNCIIYKEEENSHLKLVGKLYDQCQDTLVQFGSFLATNLSMDDYICRLPKINELMGEYRITSDVAFFLSRPMFSHAITLKFDEMRRQDKSYRSATEAEKMQRFLEVVDVVMRPAIESVRSVYSLKVWDDISPQFFVTFFALSMYDLHVPEASYEKEINKLKMQIAQIEDNKDMEISKLKMQIAQIEDNKDMVQSKKKKEIDRCKTLKDKLQDEAKRQQDHCERVMARLQSEKDSWFLSRSAKNETITQFLQLCVFPRCVFTAMDSIYCAKFVHTIHNLKTPNFSTLICYDRIFCDITYTVTSCTENEANRYGRFLSAMLETVMRWHSDKAIFEKDCANYPGFVTKFRVANQQSETACDHVDYENYRHVCHKWHYKITKSLVICLESGEYVQIRNALIVLTKIISHYPMITNLGQVIEKRIENVRVEEKEKRPDLYVLTVGYAGQLKAKKPLMIPEHEFHQREIVSKVLVNQNGPKGDNHVKVTTNSITPEARPDKVKESAAPPEIKEKERRIIPLSKSDSREIKASSGKSSSEMHKSTTNSTGNNSVISVKRESSSVRSSSGPKDTSKEHAGGPISNSIKETDRRTKGDGIHKDGRNNKDDSPQHRVHHERAAEEPRDKDGKAHSKGDIDRDRNAGRASSVTSTGSGGSHTQRRSAESQEMDRDLKRRKVEPPLPSTGKSPHHDERLREKNKAANRSISQERKVREKGDKSHDGKSSKDREKPEKKRDRLDDHDANSPIEPKKRKDDDAAKSSGRQNGESESRERERHKRDESVERKNRSREAREEKKHHRNAGATNSASTSSKKR